MEVARAGLSQMAFVLTGIKPRGSGWALNDRHKESLKITKAQPLEEAKAVKVWYLKLEGGSLH